MVLTLGEIAEELGAELHGDPSVSVTGLGTLKSAGPGELSFFANPRYRAWLESTQAAAVLCRADQQSFSPVPVLVVKDPHLAYARISRHFDIAPPCAPGIHPRAVVEPSAIIGAGASIGANVVIEAEAEIGAGSVIMANSFIGAGCRIGEGVRIWPNVTIYHGVVIGARTTIHAGAVIGCDGFGFAFNGTGWTKVYQVGTVRIGDDVDIGAGVTIDRGAIDDTVIGAGMIIDNQVHIAHNVQVGEGTAIAAQVGVAGSTSIGRFCVFGGQVGIAGHLQLADQVQVLGKTMVTGSLNKAGTYASGIPADSQDKWRKNAVRFRQLDEIAKRLRALEKRLGDDNSTD